MSASTNRSTLSTPDHVTTARLLVVDPLECVDALLETRPPRPTTSPYSFSETRQPLESVIRRPDWQLPPDTPIARLDLLPYHEGRDFVLRGPMPAAWLPVGTVKPPSGPRRPYRGEHWDTLGMLTYVSVDVYLALVCQIGGVVTLAADTPTATDAPAPPTTPAHPGGPTGSRVAVTEQVTEEVPAVADDTTHPRATSSSTSPADSAT